MVKEPQMMTNREIYTEFEKADGARRYELLTEMTKRISRRMVSPDVPQIFKQYKLNGAGDKYT